MTPPRALIVDDEADIRELLEITLRRMDVDTTAVGTLDAAYGEAREHGFDLCLTDMRLPDGDGIDFVRHMHRHRPNVPVAVITAHGSMDTAIEALKAGAFDFLTKPVDLQVLRNLVQAALRVGEKRAPSERRLIGDSRVMQETRATIAKLARSQAPVYVSGESGTGKELVARMIHEMGPRAEAPFVPVNCGAIPQELMESELFGHRKGSFTGAIADKQGLFQSASGGTLFLDEVADLPLHMQVKLLRVIQEKTVRPVGAEREVPVDVRILSASHRDLGDLVRRGAFRQDLYFRLDVINLHVPALRDRPEDIPQLAEHVLARLCGDGGTGALVRLSDPATEALCRHAFDGNVRELENILERALTLCEGDVIEVGDLRLPAPADAAAPGRGASIGEASLDEMLESLEKDAIVQALEQTGGNKAAAARLLGISKWSLGRRIEKLGLE